MADIQTEHRGYTVRYSENEDNWRCYDLDLEDASLAKLKERIDKLLLKVRKESAVDVLIVGSEHSSHFSVTEGRAIDAKVGFERQRSSYSGDAKEPIRKVSLGIFSNRRGGDRGGKSFYPISDVSLPTPEVYAAVAEVERLRKIAKAAEDAVKAAVRAIPRISEDDVAGLIRAATEKHEV